MIENNVRISSISGVYPFSVAFVAKKWSGQSSLYGSYITLDGGWCLYKTFETNAQVWASEVGGHEVQKLYRLQNKSVSKRLVMLSTCNGTQS